MIRYIDTRSRVDPPTWLAGAAGLQCTAHRDGALWGIGDPMGLYVEGGKWFDLADDYRVSGSQDPREIARASAWYDRALAVDGSGQWWSVPRILNANGTRAFRVRYGADWMPALSPEQVRAEAIAKEARAALTGGGDLSVPVACQWSAEMLSIASHITPEIIAAMGIMDDVLMAQVLALACGVAEVA